MMTSGRKRYNLTELEVAGLDAEVNVSDGHPRQALTEPQQQVIGRLPTLFEEAKSERFEELEQRAQFAFLDCLGQRSAADGRHAVISSYSSSVATAVLARCLADAGARVALIHPTFDNIPDIFRSWGVSLAPLGEAQLRRPERDAVEAIAAADCLFVTTPNNPTGWFVNEAELERLASICARHGTLLVLDTSFRGFETRALYDSYNVLDAVGASYIVIEDTGKLWPTSELKLGFLVTRRQPLPLEHASSDILLSVSPLILRLVEEFALISERDGFTDLHRLVRDNRDLLARGLAAGTTASLADPDSRVSVARVRLPRGVSAERLTRQLREDEGVHVLPCGPFHWAGAGLGKQFVRVALARDSDVIGTAAEAIARALSRAPTAGRAGARGTVPIVPQGEENAYLMSTQSTAVRAPEALFEDPSLAINGGAPRLETAPDEATGIVREAADAVAEVVRTGKTAHWGGGPRVREFEQRFAETTGRRFAFFHNSGSAALQTALYAVGVEPGTPVAVSSSGFVAAINVLYHLRARPVLLPTDPDTLVCRADVGEWIEEPPPVLFLTHFLGNVVDVPAVARSTGAAVVVEDAGQAEGALLNGSPIGSFGAVGSFACSHKKLVTAGQGGLNVFDDEEIGARMKIYAHHGKGRRKVSEVPGYNFRGSELGAVLAMAALIEIDERVRLRNATYDAIASTLSQAGIKTAGAPVGVDCTPAWFDVCVVLPPEWTEHRDWLVKALLRENVPAAFYPSLIEMPWLEPWMRENGWWGERESELLKAERSLWGRTFVIGTQMAPADGVRVADVIVDVLCA